MEEHNLESFAQPAAADMKHHVRVSSRPNPWILNLKEVWQYRDLVLLMAQKSFKITYKQTVLGPAWLIIQPLLASAVYAVFFGEIAAISTEGVPMYLFYLLGHALWSLFSSSLTANASVLTSNAYIFGKVYFPRLVIPFSNALVSVVKFLIQLFIVLGFLIYYTLKGAIHPAWNLWIFLPLITLQLSLMGMSCGLIISSVTTKYRDLNFLIGTGVMVWMYGTPVVYPLAQIQNKLLFTLIKLNPVTAPVELFRHIAVGSGQVMPWHLLWSLAFTIVCFLGGILLFNRVEKNFIDRA